MVTLFNLLRNCQTFFCILLNTCYFFSSVFTHCFDYHFMCLLTNCISSLEKFLFKYFAYLLIWLLVFLLLNWRSSLHYVYKFFIRYMICKYFLPFCFLFSWWNKEQNKQTNKQRTKVLNLNKAQFVSILSFVICDFGVISKNVLHNPKSQRSSPMFLSKSL